MTFEELAVNIMEADTEQDAITHYRRAVQSLPASTLWSIPNTALKVKWGLDAEYRARKLQPRGGRKPCAATYWFRNQELSCQRVAKAFPHVQHYWQRRLPDGGILTVEWTT